MQFWQLGNTSVRSALRIRDGVVALSQSTLQGNIRQGQGDIAFRKLLGECGIVSLGTDSTNSVGRKWRSAMGKLGFIYPEVKPDMGFAQNELGPVDMITPAGYDLVHADSIAAIQECFLRAMTSPTFPTGDGSSFAPLRWVLALMLELDRRTGESYITFPEFAVVVITTTPSNGVQHTVDQILTLRSERENTESKRRFDRELYDRKSEEFEKASSTFRDYADMNIRYLKATGLVQAKGKGISLIPEKRMIAIQLVQNLTSSRPKLEIYKELCLGAELPTDHGDMASQVLNSLIPQARDYGIQFSLAGKRLDTPAHINQVRYDLEKLIAEKKEEQYADRQAEEWQEIASYMDMIAARKERMLIDEDTEIRIPKTETPAYLEWSLWRAILAIDSLINKPYEVRRFRIDQDFMPVSTAPGKGADMVAEFSDLVIAVEVTLTESSRQEAMEGESVRRHIADMVQKYNKPVFGLFIANRIDSNTAETFRSGSWYLPDDTRLKISVVPITLSQFSAFFKAVFSSHMEKPEQLFALMNTCLEYRDQEAPQWKESINKVVNEKVQMLLQES